MSKNKLKFVVFIVSFLAFIFFCPDFIRASEYEINVSSIEGLSYGNKLNEATIVGSSEIEGEFSFYQGDSVLKDIGEIDVEIVFTPSDLQTYSSKKVTIKGNVSPRKISVFFYTPLYKQYDGNTTIDLPDCSYVGIIDNEVNVVGKLVGVLDGSYVGQGIGVTLSGVTIEGENSECYYIDFYEHTARIYPSTLEKEGENATIIRLERDVYVDTIYSLKVVVDEEERLIKDKYTSFLTYSYEVYNHNNQLINVEGKYDVLMSIDESVINIERLNVYELTSKGEYKELAYAYKNGKIHFIIDNGSSIVFATRNIEYGLIVLFSGILVFSLLFVVVYRYRNNKVREYKRY